MDGPASIPVPRLVTVRCPDWPVVAAGAASGGPAVVLRSERVIARNPAAAEAGVALGHRRRHAQRTCPEVRLLEHDPARDARAFEPVVRAVVELSPRLDVVEPGWLCLGARGPSRYFGGDLALAERLTRLIAGIVGAPVGVGVADGRAVSAVAARRAVGRGRPVVVEPGGSAAYVAPLPVAWLRELGEATPELVDLLVRLGIATLGDLAALPAADLLARFGPEGLHVHRLARGDDPRPPSSVDPTPERSVERRFDDPVGHAETVVFVAKQLADELVGSLRLDGRVCTRLVVELETEHGERSERAWYRDAGLSAPAMVERVRWQLDGWSSTPGAVTAGIVLVRLVPDEVRGDVGRQGGFWGGRSQADRDAARAITRLTGLAGESAVRVPVWSGGRLPADRYRWVPASTVDHDADPAPDRDVGLAAARHPSNGSPVASADRAPGPWPGAVPAPSPALAPAEPVTIEVLDRHGSPVQVSGRGVVASDPHVMVVDGRRRQLTAWAGPWPLEQHWWDPRRHRRLARFQVVTDTGDAYLLAVEHRRWWVLAAYR